MTTIQEEAAEQAYIELSIRWIAITSMEQDLALGNIEACNVSSSQGELENRRSVYEERLSEFADLHGHQAAAALRERVEKVAAVPRTTKHQAAQPHAKRACKPIEARTRAGERTHSLQGSLFDLLAPMAGASLATASTGSGVGD